MSGVGVTAAHLLVALGAACIVAAVAALAGWPWALLTGGLLLAAYGLLLVNVPEHAEHAEVPKPGLVPVGPAGVSRAGR